VRLTPAKPCDAEVCELHGSVGVDQDVLGLDVPMDDLLEVTVPREVVTVR
jgi:hypothetical protein